MDYDEWNEEKIKSLTNAYVSRIDKDAVKRVVQANLHLERTIGRKKEQATLRKQEEYLLDRKEFPEAIANARNQLDIKKNTKIDELDINDWINKNVDPQLFHKVIKSTLEELRLTSEWGFYITVYVINNQPPDKKYVSLHPMNNISVESVETDGELIVRLKPGLRKEDYLKAWEAFSDHLGKPQRLPKANTESKRDSKIHKEFKDGATRRMLARKYFPNQDEITGIEKVVKIIKRQRTRRTQ